MHHKNLFMPLALISAMASAQQVYAANDFVVRDIKIDGLVRLLPANVYGLIPVSSGDRASDAVIADSIRALYASGLFDDIKASNENGYNLDRNFSRFTTKRMWSPSPISVSPS